MLCRSEEGEAQNGRDQTSVFQVAVSFKRAQKVFLGFA